MGKNSRSDVLVMHLADGSTVMGRMHDLKGNDLRVKNPLLLRKLPVGDSVYLQRYNMFNTDKTSKVSFNIKNLISFYVGDPAVGTFYDKYVDAYDSSDVEFRTAEVSNGILQKANDQAVGPTADAPRKLTIEELRKSTTRIKTSE